MMNDVEANLFEVFLGFVDILIATESLLITVLFAFLIAIYFAGAKLTRMQLVLIVGIYSVFYLSQVWAFMQQFLRTIEFAREIEQLNPARQLAVNFEIALLQTGLFLVFYIATLIFLYQIRRIAKKKLEQA